SPTSPLTATPRSRLSAPKAASPPKRSRTRAPSASQRSDSPRASSARRPRPSSPPRFASSDGATSGDARATSSCRTACPGIASAPVATLRVLYVMDPLAGILVDKDTPFAFMLEGDRRDHERYPCGERELLREQSAPA